MRVALSGCMLAAVLFASFARAQGSLDPPGPPGPTMVSLSELDDSLGAVAEDIAGIHDAVGEVDFDVLHQDLVSFAEAIAGFDFAALMSVTNVLALMPLTNTIVQVDVLTDVLLPIDFGRMADNIEDITNALSSIGAIDADVLNQVHLALLEGLETLNGQLYALNENMSGLSNAMQGVDWSDILEIRRGVEFTTNVLANLAGLDELVNVVNEHLLLTENGMLNISNSLADAGGQLGVIESNTVSILTELEDQEDILIDIILIAIDNHSLLEGLTNAP